MTRDVNDSWERIELVATGVGSGIDFTRTLLFKDGKRMTAFFDMDGGVAALKLRESMWEPYRGTWYIGHFSMTRTGETGAEYNYDSIPLNPGSGETPDDIRDELIEDQNLFPRAYDRLAGWHPSRNADTT
jgi:hypothetical protein